MVAWWMEWWNYIHFVRQNTTQSHFPYHGQLCELMPTFSWCNVKSHVLTFEWCFPPPPRIQQLSANPIFGIWPAWNRHGDNIVATRLTRQGLRRMGRWNDWYARDIETFCECFNERYSRHASTIFETRSKCTIQGEFCCAISIISRLSLLVICCIDMRMCVCAGVPMYADVHSVKILPLQLFW